MKFFTLRRLLLAGLLLLLTLLLLGAGAVWMLRSEAGRQRLERLVRAQLRRNTELVVSPFTVEFSLWQEFPSFTASLEQLTLTDTAHRRAVTVLRVGRADLRLALRPLLRGRVQVDQLTLRDVEFNQLVDARGRTWGLRGKGKRGPASSPSLRLTLDSLRLHNVRLNTRNEFKKSSFSAQIHRARLTARLRQGILRVGGTLDGELLSLRNHSGELFRREPVQAWVNYRYVFARRQGQLWHTRATLNADTVRVWGTHTAAPGQLAGTELNLRMAGTQPLLDVLRTALPPTLLSHLEGATSPSKAHIHFSITGRSGPTTRPRNVLRFGLRNARIAWPDTAQRIDRWDLRGVLDNGAQHAPRTTSLTFRHCRLYSRAGQLDLQLALQNFEQPTVAGRIRGRTDLPQLAAVVSPGLWRARRGTADMDLRLHGPLPTLPGPGDGLPQHDLSVRGTLALRDASFVLLDRHADFTNVNVRIGLQDSLWRLNDFSGTLDRMRFQATATTTYLLAYLTGTQPRTYITGNFAVEELRLARVRQLLRPGPTPTPPPATSAVARKRANATPLLSIPPDSSLLPPGLRLAIGLRCGRLVLANDTVRQLAAQVRHDGRRIVLSGLRASVWGGQATGQATLPTSTDSTAPPADFRVAVHFSTIDYRRLTGKLNRPPVRTTTRNAPSPALRDLLLAANGQLSCTVSTVRLGAGENLQQLRLQLVKTGQALRMPTLSFRTTRGGQGQASAFARVKNNRLVAADANVDLRYATLDVQHLLRLLAGLDPGGPPPRPAAAADPGFSIEPNSLLATGALTATLHVQAGQVRYAALTGQSFLLKAHLRAGEAHIDDCTLNAFRGRVRVQGRLLTRATLPNQYPLFVQMAMQDIQLPEAFTFTEAMRLNLLEPANVQGVMQCRADIRTRLNEDFLPAFDQTYGYLQADIRDLELLNVEPLQQALRFLRDKRTSQLVFEPVSTKFVFDRGRILLPGLRLNSNLTDLEVSGEYGLDGRANMYLGINPLQALFSNNDKRVARIRAGEAVSRTRRGLVYVNLRRAAGGGKFVVRPFKKQEQRQQQQALRQHSQQVLSSQKLDTTLHTLRQ